MLSMLDLLGIHFGDIFDKMRAKGCSKSLFEKASKKGAKRRLQATLEKRSSDPSAPIRNNSRIQGFQGFQGFRLYLFRHGIKHAQRAWQHGGGYIYVRMVSCMILRDYGK